MIIKNLGRRVIVKADLKKQRRNKEQLAQINKGIIPAKLETIEILKKYCEARPIQQFCIGDDEGKVLSVEGVEKKKIQELETIGLISTRMNVNKKSIVAQTTPFGKSFITKSGF